MSQAETKPSPKDEHCTICHIPQHAHNMPNILHEFRSPGQQPSLVARSQQSPAAHEGNRQGANRELPTSAGSDAILRLALLRKGIITVADLDFIEAELRVAGKAGFTPPVIEGGGDDPDAASGFSHS